MTAPTPSPAPPRNPGLQFARLAARYWNDGHRWRVRGAITLLVLLTMTQVGLAIWVSYWHRDLFDALEARSLSALLGLVATFALIFVLTMAVTALHIHVKRWVQLDWRRALTSLLLDRWMAHTHAYRLRYGSNGPESGAEHDNPDGRIAEDVRIATEVAVAMTHSLLYALLLLGGFIQVLLAVSGDAPLPSNDLVIPGYLVLMAFLYAGAGTALGLVLGRPLIRSTHHLQAMEANLRFSLAQARERSEAIALMHGENEERRHADHLFADVSQGWNRQTLAYLGIVSFSTGYGALLPVFPILIAAPAYIGGAMTLGLLMQCAQAFQRLATALSWPIDNLGELARCRASIERIITLYNDTEVFEQARPDAERASGRVTCLRSALPELLIRRLSLATPDGRLLLDDFNLRVRRGERLLITGDPAVTASLFKAVAGLWPWGHGEILLPSDGDMMFLPQQPLLPEGSLRAALSYPHAPDHFEPAALHYALECAGIAWLAPRLDDSDDWSRVLPLRAQQRLGIARVFLQRPGWIFIEEATSTFDAKTQICMVEMLHRELPSATLLNISQQDDPDHHYTGRLELGHARRHAAPAAVARASDKA